MTVSRGASRLCLIHAYLYVTNDYFVLYDHSLLFNTIKNSKNKFPPFGILGETANETIYLFNVKHIKEEKSNEQKNYYNMHYSYLFIFLLSIL